MNIYFEVKCVYFLYPILILMKLTSCALPTVYLENLLSRYYFKGYDLIVSTSDESESNFTEWLTQGKNSMYSVTVAEKNLTKSLEEIFATSQSLEQIAIIIEFQNISHLENEMKMAKKYSLITSVPQPVYFVIVSSPNAYQEIKKNLHEWERLSLKFSINSDFYIFGESGGKTLKNEKGNDTDGNNEGTKYTFMLPFKEYEGPPLADGFMLQELYSLKNITFLQEVNLVKTNLVQKVLRRSNFRQAPVTAAAQESSENITKSHELDQIDFLAKSFNFSIIHKPGTGWIDITSDNKLTGMGEQLLTREADIAISSSEMLEYRAEQLTFLHSTYVAKIWGFFKQPTSNSLRDIFINAFSLDLWLTMFATWFLIIMAMMALAIVKWRLGTLHENDKIVIQEVFIWAAGAICQQGWHVCPESGCMKIVFIFALITGLVSYVGYSAALVSILSIKVIPIKSLSDLVTYHYTIYQDNQTLSTNDIIKQLESRMKLLPYHERSVPSSEGLQKIMNTQSAFLGVADLFYPAARSVLCSDRTICKNINGVAVSKDRPIQAGMYVRKRSAFADFFNHRILLMYEWGIRHRLLQNFLRENSVLCLDLNASEKEPLGFNDVVTAYIILLIGYLLSLALLVMEKLCATTLAQQRNTNSGLCAPAPFSNQHKHIFHMQDNLGGFDSTLVAHQPIAFINPCKSHFH